MREKAETAKLTQNEKLGLLLNAARKGDVTRI
jgi:hypothetical protein